jgi:hypothetical protein
VIFWSFQTLVISFVQTLEDGDMALLDMGAEYHFYGSDITCSFPVSLTFLLAMLKLDISFYLWALTF